MLYFFEKSALQFKGGETLSGDQRGTSLEGRIRTVTVEGSERVIQNQAGVDQTPLERVRMSCIGPTRNNAEPCARALSKKMT